MKHKRTVEELNLLSQITKYNDWSTRVGSTWNRLKSFSDSPALRRFMGTKGALDLQQCIDKKAIVLVNLAPTPDFTFEHAAMFAALLLSQFTTVSGKYYLDLDECAYYATFDVCRLLDLMCKRGLRVTLVCHSPEQFEDPRVQVSLDVNCGIKVVFGGLPHAKRKALIPDFHPEKLHERWVKDWFYSHQVTGYDLDYYSSQTVGDFGGSETYSERLVPRIEKVLSGVSEWSYEEKMSMLAETLKLNPRNYVVQLPDKVQEGTVPEIRYHFTTDAQRVRFRDRHPQGISPQEADEQVGESHVAPRKPRTKNKTLAPL